ncbi:MAG TPA: tetratricopeptide repeat protein [Verrucomicrobiae bacterium]|nr:tetratricopeptide repeat protein [Verrucomicrobiae bacterium]
MGYLYGLLYSVPWLGATVGFVIFALQIWMIIDCVVNGNEWYWILVILMLGPVGVAIYFFACKYRTSRAERSLSKRFLQRRRIRELQAKIYHLDKGYHFSELGDIYREQHKWALAEAAYRSALEREPDMLDARAYLGFVLLAQNRADDAWKFLEPAFQQQPGFKSGELLWQCARCQAARGQQAAARELYERLLAAHGYFEAHYEYTVLLDRLGERDKAIASARELVEDVKHAPRFHQRASRPWGRRARRFLRGNRATA